jgi:pimeloyl-ACP methyl ester carboxylesterase
VHDFHLLNDGGLMTPKIVFLPGALGAAEFWRPVGDLLPVAWNKVYLAWPGLGAQPKDETVNGFDDLVRLVERELDQPCDLVAQSLGGIVAIRVALGHRDKVRRLVLAGTSGGLDVAALGGAEWRDDYRRDHPGAATWITTDRPDHSQEIGMLSQPTLLLWGDADPISPVAVGEQLRSLLPTSTLEVIAGGTHSFAREQPELVARLVLAHASGDARRADLS